MAVTESEEWAFDNNVGRMDSPTIAASQVQKETIGLGGGLQEATPESSKRSDHSHVRKDKGNKKGC